MELVNIIKSNVIAWLSGDILVCTGYAYGEVLSENETSPSQLRVLTYLQNQEDRVIRIQHAYEIYDYIQKLGKPKSVELVGAWYNECVYNTIMVFLKNNVPVKVNPALTLCRLEVNNIILEDIDYKKEWFKKYINGAGFSVKEIEEFLVCSSPKLPTQPKQTKVSNTKSKNIKHN